MAASERRVASSFRQLARVYTDIRASGSQSPRISFDENDQRPYVITYAQKPKFHVGDKVYLLSGGSRQGPYEISSVTSGGYTLSLENGTAVRNGEEIHSDYLEAA